MSSGLTRGQHAWISTYLLRTGRQLRLNRLSRAGAVGADDGALQVETIGVVERAAAGDQGHTLLRGRSCHLVQRDRCRVVLTDPPDGERVDLAIVPSDNDLVARLKRREVVKDRGTNVPIVDVTGHNDVAGGTEGAEVFIPGDDPWSARILHRPVDHAHGLDTGVDAGGFY